MASRVRFRIRRDAMRRAASGTNTASTVGRSGGPAGLPLGAGVSIETIPTTARSRSSGAASASPPSPSRVISISFFRGMPSWRFVSTAARRRCPWS
jgi:hypothetical protein